MHPDGYIELRDRAKDIIISGGENISTIEVEQAIAAHPAVLEVAVIGIPDDYWGEAPKAFVVLRDGATATEEEIIAHCQVAPGRLQVPEGGSVRRVAEDVDRQDPEVRAARTGMGRARKQNQLALTGEHHMRHLHIISFLMFLIGLIMTVAGAALDLGAVVTLIGMMLVVAGVVKIITVRIWNGYFDSDTIAGE